MTVFVFRTRQINRKGDYQISKPTKDGEKASTSKVRGVEEDTKVLLGDNHESSHSNKAKNHYSAVQNKNSYDGIYNEIKPDVLGGAAEEVKPRKKKNPYASYDSLDFDEEIGADMVGGRRYSARCSAEIAVTTINPPLHPLDVPKEEMTLPNGHQDNNVFVSEDGVPHVRINNDFYAIVQKSKTLPNGKSSVPKNTPDSVPYNHQSNGIVGGPFSSSGGLPEHDCMLHNGDHCSSIPPFPNPETYDNIDDTTQSSSFA